MLDINEILNALSELVYISDVETYELYYMNKASLNTFISDGDFKGKLCYQVLQNRTSPCEFCTSKYLEKDSFYRWEHYNQISGKYYLLRDKLIEFNGKNARIEIATDITRLKNQNTVMENLLSMDNLLINCVAKLHENLSMETRINTVLKDTGEFLDADRIYIFQTKNEAFHNTYEWCKAGVSSQRIHLQEMSHNVFNRWIDSFDRNNCIMINDIEEIKEQFPLEYQILQSQDIHSLVAAPVKADGELIGIIGIDNPPSDKLKNSPGFFSTIGYFLASIITSEETEKRLRDISFKDNLTDLYNRNRFISDMNKYNLTPLQNIGIVYIDLNGLKEINDNYGHMAGDNKLIRLAQILKCIFDKEEIYRIGGDEFCVISTPVNEKLFLRKMHQLRDFLSDEDDCSASMGFEYKIEANNIDDILKNADEKMYEDKKAYYKKKTSVHRFRQYEDC